MALLPNRQAAAPPRRRWWSCSNAMTSSRLVGCQHSGPAFLGYLHRPDRPREIRPRRHPIPQRVEVPREVLLELLDAHAVGPGRSAIVLDLQPRIPHQSLGDVMRLALQLRLMHAIPSFRLTTSTIQNDPPLGSPPLRYAEASQLLQASPPACPATVLCSSRILPLGALPLAASLPATVSGLAFTRSIEEPRSGSCCLYAGRHLGSKRVAPRLIPRQTGGLGFDVNSRVSTRPRQRTLVHRSSSRPTPDAITAAPSPTTFTTAPIPECGFPPYAAKPEPRASCVGSFTGACTPSPGGSGIAQRAALVRRRRSRAQALPECNASPRLRRQGASNVAT